MSILAKVDMFDPQKVLDSIKFDFLYIDVTAACNLRCKHCIFGIDPTDLTEQELTQDERKIIIRNAVAYGINRVLLSGKELFLFPEKTLELLGYLSETKESLGPAHGDNLFQFGFITNGTLVKPEHIERIPRNIGWIDVSMEGTEEFHERVRGKGVYGKSLATIDKLVSTQLPVCVAFTATSLNVEGIADGIREFIDHGVTRFFISHYVPLRHDDPLRTPAEKVLDLINELADVSDSHPPIKILFELEGPYAVLCMERSLFGANDLSWKPNKPHEFYANIRVNLIVKWQRVFNFFLHDIRVSPDGWVITCEEEHPAHYSGFMNRRQSINIRDCKYDFNRLEERIKTEQKIFNQYLQGIQHHACRDMPCFEYCYGGNQYAHFVIDKVWSRQSMNCNKTLINGIKR